MEKSQELREVLLRYLDADLERIIFSNPLNPTFHNTS